MEEGFVARVADNERQATYEDTDLTMSPLTGAIKAPFRREQFVLLYCFIYYLFFA
jgi:hypothetical protein